MLGDGYKPVGSVFTVLWAGNKLLTGAFSDVEGSVFDDGREKYVLSYFYPGNSASGVYLTVENNTTPEPGSLFLALLGLAGILGIRAARTGLALCLASVVRICLIKDAEVACHDVTRTPTQFQPGTVAQETGVPLDNGLLHASRTIPSANLMT